MKTNREKFFDRHDIPKDQSLSLRQIATLSDIPVSALQEVYNRGVGAWETNIRSVRLKKDFSKNPDLRKYPRSARLTKEQWAFARLYSFAMKGKTYYTTDADIVKKYKLA